jgi:SNF2 family DNA or RNA helicase
MKNGKPANLFPLLKAVKHPFGNHQRAYEAQFCGGRDMSNGIGRPLWVATGATNLDQLRVLTKSHMLHMTKDECLKELPKQTRYKKTVFVSSRSQMKHNDAMNKLSLIYSNRQDPLQQEAILGAVQNIRLVDSFAKVTATVEVAREVLRKEAAVVIFTSFVDVAKMVHEKLNEYGWTGELLTGETPPKKRQGMVDNFQNGLSPVFCCTFGAGGVGLTLTAASTVILLDRPWTPGDVHQAEDRVRRIGQTKPVTSIWMSAFELDKQIDEMIESKSQTSTTVLSEQSTAAGHNNTMPKLSILKMVHSFLSNQSSASTNNAGLKQATLPEYGHGKSRSY